MVVVAPAFIKEQLTAFLLCLSQAGIIYTGNHKLADLFELLSDVLQ